MRLRITFDDELVRAIDLQVGQGQRSAFIAAAVRAALEDEPRGALIDAATGAMPDTGHDWDDDPAKWVRAQRYADPTRVG